MKIVEISVCDFCNLHCKYCVAHTRKALKSNDYGEYQANGAILPIDATLNWLVAAFSPAECEVLITGGEPMLVPQGWEWSNRLVALGYKTYILTNGVKMPYEAARWNKAAHYLLTHHIEEMPFADFEMNVKAMVALGFEKLTLQTIITPQMLYDKWELEPLKERLAKFNLPFFLTGASKQILHGDYYDFHCEKFWEFEKQPKPHSETLHIFSIRPQGTVHLCHANFPVGSIYAPFNAEKNSRDWQCFEKDKKFTLCSVENTILSMRQI